MKRFIQKAIAIPVFVGLALAQCSAATVLVDTIGDGSKYQLDRDIEKSVSLGFNPYPISGDFTGVRPAFNDAAGVTAYGTTGVPCSEIWSAGAPGTVSRTNGKYAAWLIQPFKLSAGTNVRSVDFIAQLRDPVGPLSSTRGKTAYVSIWQPSSDGKLNSAVKITPYVMVDLASATRTSVISAVGFNASLSGDTTYWLVFSPVDQLGVWNANGLNYANLNWAWKSAVNDNSKVTDILYQNENGNGEFYEMPGRVLGVKIYGDSGIVYDLKSVAEARMLADGANVDLQDVVITGKTGSVGPGFFYVQMPDRSCGIKVIGTTSYNPGSHIQVKGAVTMVGVERAIELHEVNSNGTSDTLRPVMMTGKSIGGLTVEPVKGPTGGIGLNNVGLLVKLTGSFVSGSCSEFILNDGSGDVTVRAAGMTIPTSGTCSVTGIVSLEESAGVRKVVILARNQDDIHQF